MNDNFRVLEFMARQKIAQAHREADQERMVREAKGEPKVENRTTVILLAIVAGLAGTLLAM